MNTFERELRKAVRAAGREDRARYVGRAAYLELDSGLHAKLQFVTQGIADRYGALQLSAISRTRGEIDRVTVRFEDVWGGQAPYLWRCDGKTEWYGAVPTPGDMELLARQTKRSAHCMNRTRGRRCAEWDIRRTQLYEISQEVTVYFCMGFRADSSFGTDL